MLINFNRDDGISATINDLVRERHRQLLPGFAHNLFAVLFNQ